MPAAQSHLPRITRWIKGLVTQRNPIDTPYSIVGMNVISHNDALFDGFNIEVTSNNTLMRRWGLTKWMNIDLPPNTLVDGFWSFRNLSGVLRTIATANTGIYAITPTGFNVVNSPIGLNSDHPWAMATSGDYAYFTNGDFDGNGNPLSMAERWQPDHPLLPSGQTLFKWGIDAPTVAPIATSGGLTVNAYVSKFAPLADIIAGIFTVNQPDLGIQFSATVVNTTLTISWLYTQYPLGPGPVTASTGTTPAGQPAVVGINPEAQQAVVTITVTGITPTVQGIISALSGNTSLTVDTYGHPQVSFDPILGNINPAGSVFKTANGAAFRVVLSPQSNEPQMGFADITQPNYDLQMTPGTLPITSYFQLPFTTLTDELAGVVFISNRADHGSFTTYVINVPAFPNNNLQGLTDAVIAGLPPSAVVNLYKTGKTGQLNILPVFQSAESITNNTWTITDSAIINNTLNLPLSWNIVDTNLCRVKPINTIQFGFVWRNEITGHVSTMSPSITYESKSHGSWVSIIVNKSNTQDPQVTYPELYVTADGGSSFLLAPQFYQVTGSTYNFYYFTGDEQLNPQVAAPLDFANNPPPFGLKGVIKHTQRMWGFVDNLVYFSGGPDTTNGLGDEAWPPSNNFAFPGPVVKIETTANGLMVFLQDNLHVIEGTDISSYYPHPFAINFGISNPRAEFYDGQTMFIYTTSRQLHAVSPGNQDEIGYDIADQLQANFDPLLARVVVHRGPSTDFALFISNGVDRMFRYAPNKGWSTVGIYDATTIGSIASIETQPGLIQLLCAPSSSATPNIYFRDYTSYQDNLTPYEASATIGGIALVDPGELIPVNNIILQMTAAGNDPSVSILLNELSGDFQQLSAKDGPIFDPPTARPPSTTLKQKRYWCADSLEPIIERANTIFVKLDFPAENAKSEVLSLFTRSEK